MACETCGEKPKKCGNCNKDFPRAVIEINNPEALVLLRKIVVPASMGTEEQVPPAIGKYHNVILYYEANKHVYIYSSDGIPTFIEAGDSSGGGDSDIIELTSDDYNYPEDNPNSIALWKLGSGIYSGTGITVKPSVGASTTVGGDPKSYFYIHNNGLEANILVIKSFSDMITRYKTLVADGAYESSTSFTILDTLSSTRSDAALSANQGKILSDSIKRMNDYSTSSVDTKATWIDGSPIYKKTIDTGALPNNAMKTVPHGVGVSLKRAIKIEGYAYSSSFGINMSMPGPEIAVQVAGADIEITSSADLSTFTESYVTLYYTKTQ